MIIGKNYNFTEAELLSSDGIHKLYAEIYTPRYRTARGIVQLSHGMVDYVGRYEELANYLTGEGYIFAGNHHLGHGKTARDESEFGFFAPSDGVSYVVRDLHRMNRFLRDTFPTLPVFMMGHSMGSFLARLYVAKYPHTVKGAIIHGTAGRNPVAGLGIGIAKLVAQTKGPRHRSKLLHSLTTGPYNKKFDKSEGTCAWLSRDREALASHDSDPYSTFLFTASGYTDLMRMLRDCNSRQWFMKYPKHTPTLIMSGECDPVGAFGKGPRYVYKHLMIAGHEQLEIKTYEGARHELFLETNREEVFSDILAWLDKNLD